MTKCVFVGGSIEPNEFALLNRVLTLGQVFVDVGANEGLYTIFASKKVGEKGAVVAIEPSLRDFSRVKANVRRNGLRNVRLKRLALGSEPGTQPLHIANSEHAGLNSFGPFSGEGAIELRTENVEVQTLDTVVRNEGLHRVDLVKIDTEGAEAQILRGARQVLRSFRPMLLLELSQSALASQGGSVPEVLNYLHLLDYEIYSFDHASGLPTLATKFDELSSNILAIHQPHSHQDSVGGSRRVVYAQDPDQDR